MNRPPHASHHCRHYSYSGSILSDGGGPKCARGFDLSAPRATLPCMPDRPIAGPVCTLREEYTGEEREAWQAWRDERAGRIYIAGEDIDAGAPVVCSAVNGKLYGAGKNAPSYATYVGEAVEQIREGFRVAVSDDGEVREDDA